jgi:hypothetical protein
MRRFGALFKNGFPLLKMEGDGGTSENLKFIRGNKLTRDELEKTTVTIVQVSALREHSKFFRTLNYF